MWRLQLSGCYLVDGEIRLPYSGKDSACIGQLVLFQVDDYVTARAGIVPLSPNQDAAAALLDQQQSLLLLDFGANLIMLPQELTVSFEGSGHSWEIRSNDTNAQFEVRGEVNLSARTISCTLGASPVLGRITLHRSFPLGDVTRDAFWIKLFEAHFSRARPWTAISSHERLENSLKKYFALSEPDRNVFIMMRFARTEQNTAIRKILAASLRDAGLTAQFADDLPLADDLWDNVCTYMLGSRFGIAVVEEIEERTFNPNVAIEIGFMRALQRPVLVLKDRRIPSLPADLIGKIYKEFDSYRVEETISSQIALWTEELRTAGLLRDTYYVLKEKLNSLWGDRNYRGVE